MKAMLLVEDRDSGFLFLDTANAPEGAAPMDFTLAPGVLLADAEDDDKVVWLSTDTAIRVVPRETVDFSAPMDKEWPIPSCAVCLTAAEYETLVA